MFSKNRGSGFTQSRWNALLGYWDAVVMVRVVLSLPLLPGIVGFLRIFMASRRDVGVRKWTGWLREDASSRPYVWLRPDFVPPPPFLVVKDPQTKSSRILVEPHLVDAEFRKAWMPFFLSVW